MATQASDTANNTASKRTRGASSDDLAVIAQRAQAFTNASGVAIALSEGNADEIICRARSGSSAPDVGAALRVEGTFTGLCIQSGKELRCDDCETDTRVDTAAIRALNIRSMVVAPIREDNRVTGVLAVFAPMPHAFTITHVAVLKTMADQISTLLQKARRAREDGSLQVDPVLPSTPVAAPKPAVTPVPAPAVVIKPAPAAAAAAPARATTPTAPRVDPVKSVPLEVVPLAVPTRKEERRAESSQRAQFGTFDSVAAEERKPGNRFMMIGVVAVLVIAAAATFVFLKMQKPVSSEQHVQEAANVPAVPPAAAGSQPAAEVNSAPAANVPHMTASSPTTQSGKTASESDNTKKTNARNSEKSSNVAEKPTPAEKAATEKPALVATLAGAGPSRIAQNSPSQSAPEVAPSFTVDAGNTSLSSLARPVASSTPSAAAIERSQLEPLQLIRTAVPQYPVIAKARHLSGAVIIELKVGTDGRVSSPKFISGPPVFKDAAFEAVMKYQFKAARLNGKAIEQVTQVKLNFHE
ncbi:MAG: GAF domain-containing protein [Candidatus Angelobacter sp.]